MSEVLYQTLGSVISITKGKKHEVSELPSANARRLIGIDDLRNDILVRYTDDANGTDAIPEDVLIAWDGANAGTIGFGKAGYIGSTIARLRIKTNERLFTPYLGLYLRSKFDYLRQTATGATIPHISRSALEGISLPQIKLDDQMRIAHLLGKVEALITQRKRDLQQLDDLLKSTFLEMFGFRDGTFTQWPIERLSSYTEVVSGVTKGKKYTAEELVEVPYMRVANVQDGHFVLDEVKTIAVTQKEIDQYQLRRGDLLLTEGGDPDKLGRGSVWEEQVPNCIHQNHIFRVRIHEQAGINPYYLSALVGSRYGKAYFLKSAKQTTGIASINSTQLKNFPTVVPPIDLQNQFAAIVGKIEVIKSRYQQSLTILDALYGALSQQAFKGELDLSRVPLSDQQVQAIRGEAGEAEQSSLKVEGIPPIEAVNHVVQAARPEGRSELLARWLKQYLTNTSPNARLGSAQLLESAWQTLQQAQLETDGETPALTLDDYDALKDLVFKALESGELNQIFIGDNNRVALEKRSVSWGSW